MRRILLLIIAIIILIPVGIFVVLRGGRHEGAGEVSKSRLPAEVVANRGARQVEAVAALVPPEEHDTRPTKQILFGDLHAHTTFSVDAFLRSLPMLQGEGAHP